jgi:PAS domain S-box-containing protein
MVSARKKDKRVATTGMSPESLRDAAQRQLADTRVISPGPGSGTPEALIHELQVHQIELEMQADELRRAQIALEEARDKYLDLYDFAPVGYVTLTDKALIHETNLTGAKLLGADRNTLHNARIRKFVSPEDHDRWDRYFLAVLRQDTNLTTNLPIRRQNGSVFPALVDGIRFISGDGTTTVRITFSDVTEIRRAEDALAASEERFRFAMQHLPGTLWVVGRDLRFTLSQGSGLSFIGLVPDQIVGMSLHDFFQASDPGHTAISAHLKALNGEIVEYDHIYRDITFRSVVGPIRDSAGSITGVVGIAFNITDRVRAEESLRLVNKKLNLLTSITRHDILNLLIVLNGFLDLLHRDVPNPELQDYFTRIIKTSSRIESTIRFTREYEKIGVYTPAWNDIRMVVSVPQQKIVHGTISLVNDLPVTMEVYADPLIETVFFNLFDNSIRHGRRVSEIRVSCTGSGDALTIVVEDNGIGIPVEEKERIFERGFGQNTGLGLYLAQEILSITGITIRETGTPGTGARFEIIVPKGVYRKKESTGM